MVNVWDYQCDGQEMGREEADRFLSEAGFLSDNSNRALFNQGDIKVFNETDANDIAVILQPSTGETIFFDFPSWRSYR